MKVKHRCKYFDLLLYLLGIIITDELESEI